jgi:hypothetical protein
VREGRSIGGGRRLALAAAVVLTSATALTGCTSGGDEHGTTPRPSAPSSSHAPTSSPANALPAGVTGATAVPAKVPNKPALRKDVVLSSCASAGRSWRASGTVRNPGSRDRRYTITVFFTSSTATVIGTGAAKVRVPSGAQRSWKVVGKFRAPNPTLCVLRGVG